MKLLLSFFTCSMLCFAAFDSRAWPYRSPLSTHPAPFNVLNIGKELYATSLPQLHDVRVVRNGLELPYVLRVLSRHYELQNYTPRLTNKRAVAGLGIQAVLQLQGGGTHNRIHIATDRHNFRQQVKVETSEDGQTWGVVRNDGMIFDAFGADVPSRSLDVTYPDSTYHFVRLTIEGVNDPTWLQSASLSLMKDTPAEREAIGDFSAVVEQQPDQHRTSLTFDLGESRPCDRITFDAGPGLFSRSILLSVSEEGKYWLEAGSGTLQRTTTQQQLAVEVPEQWQRYWRIQIENLNDAPLPINMAHFEGARRQIVFPAQQQSDYWLYTGNTQANSPSYDLATVLPADLISPPAALGHRQHNPQFEPPRPPASERLPFFLTALLFLLVPIVGTVAYRMLRQAKNEN